MPQLMSAKKKIGQVAAFYDPMKHSFKGFDAIALDPTQFREQLRRNFLVKLTNAELGAIVFLFDKDGDGFVDAVEFTNEFFRLGKIEREKFNISNEEIRARIEKRRNKFKRERALRLKKLGHITTVSTFTEEDEKSAIRKVAKVAFSYDPVKGGLEGFFVCAGLTEPQFREQLRRNFEITLSPAESAALMNTFDSDKNGMVDCTEFLFHFFRIGRAEKDRHERLNRERSQKLLQDEKIRLEQLKEHFDSLLVANIQTPTEEDKKSFFNKIKLAAYTYKNDSCFGDLQKSFESTALNPTQFKELLKRNFDINVTPGELGAAIAMFDDNGDGEVSCAEFMSTFFKIGLKERTDKLKLKYSLDNKIREQELERRRLALQTAIEKVKTNVIWPDLPTEDDDATDMNSMSRSTVLKRATTAPSVYENPLKKAPKAKMSDILSPIKTTSLSKSMSMVDKFPKASNETKDFLMQIEEQEKKIRTMKLPKFKDSSSKFPSVYGSSLEDRDWQFDSIDDTTPNENSFRSLTSTTNPNSTSRGFGDSTTSRPTTVYSSSRDSNRAPSRGGGSSRRGNRNGDDASSNDDEKKGKNLLRLREEEEFEPIEEEMA
jgi:Ca2+-binding EF-hand superfamily protein